MSAAGRSGVVCGGTGCTVRMFHCVIANIKIMIVYCHIWYFLFPASAHVGTSSVSVECFSRVISSISMQRDTLHPSIKLKTHAYTQHKCPQLKFMQAALCLLQTQAHNDGGKGHATE